LIALIVHGGGWLRQRFPYLALLASTMCEEWAGHVTPSRLRLLLGAVNVAECCGDPVNSNTQTFVRERLATMRFTRTYGRDYHRHLGFAALALGLPPVYPPTCNDAKHNDVERYLEQLYEDLGRIANGEPAAAAEKLWAHLLVQLPCALRGLQFDLHTLLWIARVVFARIGGHPIGEVGDRMHASIEEYSRRGLTAI
jgi:hypothetical protein